GRDRALGARGLAPISKGSPRRSPAERSPRTRRRESRRLDGGRVAGGGREKGVARGTPPRARNPPGGGRPGQPPGGGRGVWDEPPTSQELATRRLAAGRRPAGPHDLRRNAPRRGGDPRSRFRRDAGGRLKKLGWLAALVAGICLLAILFAPRSGSAGPSSLSASKSGWAAARRY